MTQLDIFGGQRVDIRVYELTRRIMRESPITWRSHRLLMKAAAKQLGFDFDVLSDDQRSILESLFDKSPDFERAARKVREEDASSQRHVENSVRKLPINHF